MADTPEYGPPIDAFVVDVLEDLFRRWLHPLVADALNVLLQEARQGDLNGMHSHIALDTLAELTAQEQML